MFCDCKTHCIAKANVKLELHNTVTNELSEVYLNTAHFDMNELMKWFHIRYLPMDNELYPLNERE